MATQNGPVFTPEQIADIRKNLGLPQIPEEDVNIIQQAMDAATEAAKDGYAAVEGFVEEAAHGDIKTLLLGYFLGAVTVLLTLLATRL